MPRIAPAEPPFSDEVQAIIDRVMPDGVAPFALFTTIARDPRLFDRFVGRGFLGRGHLTLRQRELIIARVTAQCGSEYEWGIHVHFFADKAGFDAAQLRSTVHGDATDDCWGDDDRLILRLCDALHRSCDVDDDLWRDLKGAFEDEAVMEMMMVAGNYRSVAYLTNALRLPREKFAARFPA
jgi:alkylhydroperoxidase family enzyme